MKHLRLPFGIIIIFGNFCCSKSKLSSGTVSSITLINAVNNSTGLIPLIGNGTVKWYSSSETVSYTSAYEYSIQSGDIPISICDISDTANNLFNGTFKLQAGQAYSLFVDGSMTINSKNIVDTLFIHDSLPYYSINDSVEGIRFVNLVTGNDPISIDTVGGFIGSQVPSLQYRGYTSFIAYAANSLVGGYNFEVRDKFTDSLLATFTFNSISTFKNVTIVATGANYGQNSTPVTCFTVNNY